MLRLDYTGVQPSGDLSQGQLYERWTDCCGPKNYSAVMQVSKKEPKNWTVFILEQIGDCEKGQ